MKNILFVIFSLIIITSCYNQDEDYNENIKDNTVKDDTLKIQRIKIQTH